MLPTVSTAASSTVTQRHWQGRRYVAIACVGLLLTGTAACTDADPDVADPSESASAEAERVMPEDAPYDYEAAVRERVTVFSERDDDGDGSPDPFVLDIIRPAETTDVPVILEQSPYWDGLGRGLLGETRERDTEGGPVTKLPVWYDNWFVPQGYAFVAMDTAGLGQSGGCFDNLGIPSQAGAVAALDFFAGNAAGEDADGAEVTADWSSGSVAMVGKSADAHHALLAGITGHDALDAIVSVGTVTSIWEQSAGGGIVDTPFPLDETGSCSGFSSEWNEDIGDGLAPTDAMFDADVLSNLDNFQVPTLFSQGLRDLNTRPGPTLELWEALGDHGVDRKLWLHQGGHTDPFDIRPAEWVAEVDAWLDHHLRGGPAPSSPPITLQEQDLSWSNADALPSDTGSQQLEITADGLVEGGEASQSLLAEIASMPEPDTSSGSYPPIDMTLFDSGSSNHHAAFDSASVAEPLELAGVPEVTLRVRTSGEPRGIVASLVVRGDGPYTSLDDAVVGSDVELGVGACWGGASLEDDGCYPGEGLAFTSEHSVDVLSFGQHGIGRGSWTETYDNPGDEWVEISIPLSLVNTTVPEGAQLSLVLQVDSPVQRGSGEGSYVEIEGGTLQLPLA